jgi:type III secretory pathway component EscT
MLVRTKPILPTLIRAKLNKSTDLIRMGIMIILASGIVPDQLHQGFRFVSELFVLYVFVIR